MPRFAYPQVVTANDLFSGDVVYLTPAHDWCGALDDAAIADTPEEAADLLAAGTAQQDKIVGAYLADVERTGDGLPKPVHFREAFRTRGPSNYFHGKQAE
ncbi:DUF2849 domain-containing protein [Pseudahrensia aquimaris]|uniref:DUF2849 domain-containing protein n=1 Tax=Pseudahrensia aquimaris TaxID=744461 RepID=A0ABW3FAG0_9HYPH